MNPAVFATMIMKVADTVEKPVMIIHASLLVYTLA